MSTTAERVAKYGVDVMHLSPRTVYLGGPMRGHKEYNFPAFFRAAEKLRKGGWQVLSPAENDVKNGFAYQLADGDEPEDFDWVKAFGWDLQSILIADGLVLLEGWEKSKGATLERKVAKFMRKPVWHYFEMAPDGWHLEVDLFDE